MLSTKAASIKQHLLFCRYRCYSALVWKNSIPFEHKLALASTWSGNSVHQVKGMYPIPCLLGCAGTIVSNLQAAKAGRVQKRFG
jgi:hypothetical protein